MSEQTHALTDHRLQSPVFVGVHKARTIAEAAFIYSYMTAPYMQARITALTGYQHPDFVTFADILGRNDPITGTRTNSEPTILSVLMMQKIAADIAAMVVEREQFLSDAERIVFQGIDLNATPSDEALAAFLSGLYRTWLNVPLSRFSLEKYSSCFRLALAKSTPPVAYQALLTLLLGHGGLFYM